jgi:hypothetical protein
MVNVSMNHEGAESPIDDLAYLTRSQHRIPALVASIEPHGGHSERREPTGVSSSTRWRTSDALEDEEEHHFQSSYRETTSNPAWRVRRDLLERRNEGFWRRVLDEMDTTIVDYP